MKLKKLNILLFASVALAVTGCKTNDDLNEHHFDNKLFVDVENPVTNVVFEAAGEPESSTQELYMATAIQVESPVTARFAAAPSKVSVYNDSYGTDAVPLPEEMCVIESPEATIDAGATKSNAVTVSFVNLETLDRDLTYVMPIEVTNVQGIGVLPSRSTAYFVFKGASLINVVADIAQNYLPVKWTSTDLVRGMKSITVEALIRVRDFGTVDGLKGEAMSTIFGIEGTFLVRIGDSGFPQNQVQLVNPNGNFPDGNSSLGLPTGEWAHVAVVWDATSGDRIIYYDGEEVAHDMNASGSVSLNSNCYIGYAWNDQRWLEGEISEVRIWNVQRTQEEIASHIYQVDPETAEGLVAYWKFNEGAGKDIHDYSGNGNDISAVNDLTWTEVALPESGK